MIGALLVRKLLVFRKEKPWKATGGFILFTSQFAVITPQTGTVTV